MVLRICVNVEGVCRLLFFAPTDNVLATVLAAFKLGKQDVCFLFPLGAEGALVEAAGRWRELTAAECMGMLGESTLHVRRVGEAAADALAGGGAAAAGAAPPAAETPARALPSPPQPAATPIPPLPRGGRALTAQPPAPKRPRRSSGATFEVVRDGRTLSFDSAFVCFAQLQPNDVVHAWGTVTLPAGTKPLRLACERCELRGWPMGQPRPAAPAFRVVCEGRHCALEIAADDVKLDCVEACGASALKVLPGARRCLASLCALRGRDKSGTGWELGAGASATLLRCTIDSFCTGVLAGPASRLRAEGCSLGCCETRGFSLSGALYVELCRCTVRLSITAFFLDCAPARLEQCAAVDCRHAVCAEFPDAGRVAAARKARRAEADAAFPLLLSQPHEIVDFEASSMAGVAILVKEGVGASITGGSFGECPLGVLRVCAGGRPECVAPITFMPGDVRGCGGPVATFEAGPDGRDAVEAGRVSPASEEAFLLGRGDAAGGCWVRCAPRVDLP